MEVERKKTLRVLIAYYGLLQGSHLIALARASWLFAQSNQLPFPASPPSGGWAPQVIPFLFGLGAVDAVAAGMGAVFAFREVAQKKASGTLGIISLTIAIASALVFGAGTLPSGAWAQYPVEYGVMVILFTPLFVLYVLLLRTLR